MKINNARSSARFTELSLIFQSCYDVELMILMNKLIDANPLLLFFLGRILTKRLNQKHWTARYTLIRNFGNHSVILTRFFNILWMRDLEF